MKRLLLPAALALVLHGVFFTARPGWLKNTFSQKHGLPQVVTVTLDYTQIPKAKSKPIDKATESRPMKNDKPHEQKKAVPPQKKNDIKKPPKNTLTATKSPKASKTKTSPKKSTNPKKKDSPPLQPEEAALPSVTPPSVHSSKPQPLDAKAEFVQTEEIKDAWLTAPNKGLQGVETVKPLGQISSVRPARSLKEAEPLYLKNPPPEYPRLARRRGYEGTVILEVFVDRKGEVSSLRVLKSSGHDILDAAALRSVRGWLFEPGMRGDEKVETKVRIPVRFEIK